jgi:hypothetical protein
VSLQATLQTSLGAISASDFPIDTFPVERVLNFESTTSLDESEPVAWTGFDEIARFHRLLDFGFDGEDEDSSLEIDQSERLLYQYATAANDIANELSQTMAQAGRGLSRTEATRTADSIKLLKEERDTWHLLLKLHRCAVLFIFCI